ncbi:MAG: DUF1365 domain-containing protein [Actinobacteria bacterium]|nr:DUF1365 domain-containing protein [Actinomycetota bacterium]
MGLPRGWGGEWTEGVRGDRRGGGAVAGRGGARRLTESAIYEGWVRHRRFEPIEHSFRYRFFLAYLELAELPGVLDPYPLYSARRRAPARFRRSDYLGDPARPLDECVRDVVERSGAPRPTGPVRLLTGLRYLGHSFNPVSFYYCFDPTGRRVDDVVAEVENIPWGERHAYVLDRGEREGTVLADELEKKHHVSPLMGMEQTYSFRAGTPGARLQVHIESRPREGAATAGDGRPKTFDATLSLRRRELSVPLLLGLLARYPATSLQVVAKIYTQAARLKLKGARYHSHPGRAGVAR